MSTEIQMDILGGRNPRDSDLMLRNHRAFVPSSPKEIMEVEDYDVEASSSTAACRICFDCDGQDDDLISPCLCRGTQQFVHRKCLDHWRSVREGFAFTHCTTCGAQFHLRAADANDVYCRKTKFRLFVARDMLFVFMAMQLVISVIAYVAYLSDKHGALENLSHFSWDRILSRHLHSIPFYYSVGVLAFFVLVGLFGLVSYYCKPVNVRRGTFCQQWFCGYGILEDQCDILSPDTCPIMIIIFVIILFILGIAYGCIAVTFSIQRIWQRNFHILAKEELTKEYVVQDLRGSYSPPNLDPEHEMHLKMLKLL